jgi:hypothetical protein
MMQEALADKSRPQNGSFVFGASDEQGSATGVSWLMSLTHVILLFHDDAGRLADAARPQDGQGSLEPPMSKMLIASVAWAAATDVTWLLSLIPVTLLLGDNAGGLADVARPQDG